MKQFTTESQTAKLIKLGFEKPKSVSKLTLDIDMDTIPTFNYSIGELIEMLPISFENDNDDTTWLEIEAGADWSVSYVSFRLIDYKCERKELIDALFDMIVKLKEKGVI